MSYLKKEYTELMRRIDKELKLPKDWSYFVKKQAEKQNLIIKEKGICRCNNCNMEFKSSKKINEIEMCPKCKNKYLIKRSTYTWHIFEKNLMLLDKLEDKWVIRLFEVFSRYTKDRIYHSKAVEYGRIVLGKDYHEEFANNRLTHGMWGIETVNHTKDGKKWRKYNKYYKSFNINGKLYYRNLKELFKNTEYKYSEIWTLAKKEDNIDIKYYLSNNLPSTEMLIKMGLYKLALSSEEFNKKGSFEKRFGIDRSYYKFMRDNNIDIKELEILKKYKVVDIETIRNLKRFYRSDLDKVTKYMKIEQFANYIRRKPTFDITLYLDYINFLKELRIDVKNKRNLFPKNLKQKHDEYAKQIEIKKNKKVQNKIKQRNKELKKFSFDNGVYTINPASSIEAIEDESTQQEHCVRTYTEKYANGVCDIYFMRKLEQPNKSLVTVEVRNGKIVQSRRKYNSSPSENQKKFLKMWESDILNAA